MCDLIADIRTRIIASLQGAGVSAEVAGMVATEVTAGVAQDWAGERPYISRQATIRDQIDARNRALLRDWQRGERIPLLMRRYQISRPHLYRILKISRASP